MPSRGPSSSVDAAFLPRRPTHIKHLAQQGLDAGLSAADILDKGFVKGIEEVGDLFGRGEFFLPELVQGAEAMKAAVRVLQPALDASKEGRKATGMAVAGTVAGDIHEIGKTIVCRMLSAAGFEVTDVGCDVAPETFVAKVSRSSPTSCCSRRCSPPPCPTSKRRSRP